MQNEVICEICERNECIDPWKICGSCMKNREECIKSEDRARKEMRRELDKLIGRTTPGMKRFGCSIHERRGRKIIRKMTEETFLEGSEDEPE